MQLLQGPERSIKWRYEGDDLSESLISWRVTLIYTTYHPGCKIVFDLICWMMQNSFKGFHLAFPTILALSPTNQASNVEIMLTPKCISPVYTFKFKRNDHQVVSWTQRTLCKPNFRQDSIGDPLTTWLEIHGSTYIQIIFNKYIEKNFGVFFTTIK